MTGLVREYFSDIDDAITWANDSVGGYYPESDVWLVDEILQFQWIPTPGGDGVLIILVRLVNAGGPMIG